MKKDSYSVEVIGFGQNELVVLASVFELSSRRVPRFVRHTATDALPDIFLVDADDAVALSRLSERNQAGQVPAILIGESSRGTAWPVQSRPIRWMKLFQAFDVAVATPAAEAPAKQADLAPAPAPVPPVLAPTAPVPAVAAVPPIQVARPVAPATVPTPTPTPSSGAKTSADWVLVVDDNQTVREFMKSKLAVFNFNVDYAESGEQAIGLTGQKHYTCIFLDVIMPGIDGYQVCKLIKSNRSAPKTAVVMLTSKDSPFDKIRGSMSGCDAYLTKPVDEEKLLETISRFLPQK